MQHIKYFGWIALLLIGLAAQAQFKEVKTNIINLKYSSVAWGDQDNDGDLDIFIMGWDGKKRNTRVYENNKGQFEDVEAGLPGVNSVASNNLAWADLDNDNDLDLVVTGQDGSERIAKMYSNEGSGYFKEMPQSLGGVYASTVVWGDYDNDGDLDLLMAGHMKNNKRETLVFRNNNGTLVKTDIKLQGISRGTAAWGDYDNDGDLDILVSGRYHPSKKLSKCFIYRNDNGNFTNINANLTGLSRGSSAWGDYDNDGDLDLIMTGLDNNGKRVTKLYRNNNGKFTDTRANLVQVARSSIAWGDYDNDQDLDLLIMGFDNQGKRVTKLYKNNNGKFTDAKANLMGLCAGSVAWGDYDNDGDLDILISGEDNNFNQHTKIYQNTLNKGQGVTVNPPANLKAEVKGKNVLLKWDKIKDLKGITYNIRIGTAPGKNDRLSPMANAQSGRRLVVDEGNAHHHDNWLIKNLPPGKYYWSVQTINGAFQSSKFSEEQSFTVN